MQHVNSSNPLLNANRTPDQNTLPLSARDTHVAQSADAVFVKRTLLLNFIDSFLITKPFAEVKRYLDLVSAARERLQAVERELVSTTRNVLTGVLKPWLAPTLAVERDVAVQQFDDRLGELVAARAVASLGVRNVCAGESFPITSVKNDFFLSSESTYKSRKLSGEELSVLRMIGIPKEFVGKLRSANSTLKDLISREQKDSPLPVAIQKLGGGSDADVIVVTGANATELRLVEVQPGRFAVYRCSPQSKREFLGTFWNVDNKAEKIISKFLAGKLKVSRVPPPSERTYYVPDEGEVAVR